MGHGDSFRRLLRVPLSARRQAELDIDEELRLHLELRTEELMAAGMPEEEARREAERAFGDAARARRELLAPETRRQRRLRGAEWLGDVGRDIRHGARSLLRARSFTAVAVLTLALGIGATTALFSIIDAVLLEPLPFPAPDRLTMIFEAHDERPDDRNVANPANYNDWRERSQAYASMAAIYTTPVTVVLGDQPLEVTSQLVHPDLFETLGLRPLIGRTFTAEEASGDPGAAQVVVVSESFWRSRLGGDSDVVGQILDLAGSRVEIIGVMPAAMEVFTQDAAVWMPTDYAWGSRENMGRFITVVGRVRDGVAVEDAETEMVRIAADLRAEYPDFNGRWSANVVPLDEHLSGDVRLAMLMLFGAVGVLLLIACVNVANLLLARAATRSTEIAVRSSLGAGRGRIARGLMVESMVLAAFGGVVGIALAFVFTRALVVSVPQSLQIPRLSEAAVDSSVLLFAALATLLTGLLFGIAPVMEAFRTNLAGSLREGGRGAGGGRRARRTRASLVIAEVALSLVLLTGAGLLLRSLMELQRTDLGFTTGEAVTGRITLRGERYATDEARTAVLDEAIASISAVPGVQAVGAISWLPLAGGVSATGYYLPGQVRPTSGDMPGTQVQAVQGDIFAALGAPLHAGRAFDGRDVAGGALVAIVNRAFVEQSWPGENAVGKRLVLPWGEDLELEVVGVVGDMRHSAVAEAAEPTLYMPHQQFPQFLSANLVVRTAADPAVLQREMPARLQRIDPTLALADLMPLEDVVADAVARPRLTSRLVAVFAGLALLLAAIGIYGVVSYSVALRARELGVRRALGAQRTDVARMVIGDALRLGGVGILIGLAAAFMTMRLLESLLYGVRPADPVVFAGTTAVLLGVTILASLIPTLRAMRISPAEAIRVD